MSELSFLDNYKRIRAVFWGEASSSMPRIVDTSGAAPVDIIPIKTEEWKSSDMNSSSGLSYASRYSAALGISETSARIIELVMESGPIDYDRLSVEISPGKKSTTVNTIRVLISRARDSISRIGVRIDYLKGCGYFIDDDGREKIKKALRSKGW